MSGFKDMLIDMLEDDSMQECIFAHEEQACHNAISEVASFIRSGAISFEEVERILRELPNV